MQQSEYKQVVDDLLQTDVTTKPTRVYFGFELGLKTGHKYFDYENCQIQ